MRRRRSVTDDEWMAMFDPEEWEHQKLLRRIDQLEAEVQRLSAILEDGQRKPPMMPRETSPAGFRR